MKHFTIRKARRQDLAALLDQSRALAALSPDQTANSAGLAPGILAVLERPELLSTYFVALADGKVVGQIMLTLEWNDHLNGWTAWIRRLFIRPEHRGIGIGRALCKHLMSAATDAVEYKCNVYDGNEVSISRGLLEALGFRFVARQGVLPVGHAELTTGPTTCRSMAEIAAANDR